MLGQICISISKVLCRALSIQAEALRAELLFARPALRTALCGSVLQHGQLSGADLCAHSHSGKGHCGETAP